MAMASSSTNCFEVVEDVASGFRTEGTRKKWGNRLGMYTEFCVEVGVAVPEVNSVAMFLNYKGLESSKNIQYPNKSMDCQGNTLLYCIQLSEGLVSGCNMVNRFRGEEGALRKVFGERVFDRIKDWVPDFMTLHNLFTDPMNRNLLDAALDGMLIMCPRCYAHNAPCPQEFVTRRKMRELKKDGAKNC